MALPSFESLETRTLFVAQQPTIEEVYLWQLINRARENPALEATRFGISLDEGLTTTISPLSKQPVAINAFLVNSANIHANFMRLQGQVTLVGPNGSLPQARMITAGYVFNGPAQGSAENVTALLGAPPVAFTQANLDLIHQNLFVDTQSATRADRVNMLSAGFREVGVGVDGGNWGTPLPGGGMQGSIAVVQDFALSTGNPLGDVFLTGTAYNDVNGNLFGDLAELGTMGTVTITARRLSDNVTFTTTTFPNGSGAYSLRIQPGTYDVIGTSTALGTVRYPAVVIGSSRNVLRDFTPQQATGTIPPPGTTNPTPTTPNPVTLRGDLKGKIYIDKNGDGTRDKDVDDDVLTGVKVYIDTNKNNSRDTGEAFGVVLANGTWNITGLDSGIHRVNVETPDGYRVSLPDQVFREVRVFASGLTKVRPFLITPRTIIAGTVYKDADGDGVFDATEKGLRGWRVFLDLNNDGVWQQETEPARRTQSQGKYSFRDIVPATYTVRSMPRVGFLQTQPANNGFYVVSVPADGFSVLDRDFGQKLLG